ncbi:MAG: phosphate signaling complex protein PhoU [Nitrospinae bacterium]|nr:phosphate signaling complex protein PhoU [Nitrospinota bacterium]
MARHARHLEREIEKLKNKILSLGTMVEESIQKSVKSLTERNSSLGLKVIDSDIAIDDMEVEVEEDCLKILALHQPVANDLRLIVAILKINNDLERIGDLAVNIAERAVFLATQDKIEIPEDFSQMVRKTQVMLKGSLDALVNGDSVLAREICAADDEVDEINRKMYVHIGKNMRVQPEKLDCFIHLLSASRYLERVADHATNIAEDVIYLVEGDIIRHRRIMKDAAEGEA